MISGGIRRVAMAAAAGVVVALLGAAPALAAPVKATPDADEVFGIASFSNHSPAGVAALSLNFDDNTEAGAYCIDLETPLFINRERTVEYEEGTWSESQVHNLNKVQYVLLHAYPSVKATDLVKATPGASLAGIDADQLPEIAYIATQVSVWHFSDGANYTNFAGSGHDHNYNEAATKLIKAIYDNLVATADKSGGEPEPAPTLTVTPATATAKAGEKAGPFTVKGPGGAIPLTVTGGTAIGAAGKPITTVENGDTFFLTRDSAGDVSVSLTADVTELSGRVFLYNGKYKHADAKKGFPPPKASQKLILAGSKPGKLTAGAKATFTPKTESGASPSASAAPGGAGGGELPITGASTSIAIGVGLALLVGGGVAVWLVRRRKVNFTA